MSKNDLVAEITALLSRGGVDVAVTETSKSWLFGTPTHFYKLKKRVRDHLQDLSYLRARHDNTLTEIDLNRRLAPDVYLGAVRVGRDENGTLCLDNPAAETVDWLVKMHRLPASRMLDQMIATHQGDAAQLAVFIDMLADELVTFYRSAPGTRLTAAELMTIQVDQQSVNREVLLHQDFARHHARFSAVLDVLDSTIIAVADQFAHRVSQGGIVACHGDLRPEHICLMDPPVIFDCLEFNRNLCLLDPFSEVVFLGLECSLLGAGWIRDRLMRSLLHGLPSSPDPALIGFYEASHALLRARLCFAHYLVPVPRKPEKWEPLGLRCLQIAEELLL